MDSAIKVNLSKKATSPATPTAFVAAQVSQVEIKNNQVILKGSKFEGVTEFRIEGYSQTFQIVEKSASRLVAIPSSAISLKLDTILNFILSSANAASTVPVQINLDVPGAQVNDFLQFNGTHWDRASINGLTYKGTWDASSSSDPSTSAQPGDYYIVGVNGTHSVNGVSSWTKGDWIVYADSSTGWQKIDNSMGTFALEALSNITITSPANNQVLSWNGTRWVNRTLPTFTETDPTVQAFAKATLPTCASGEVLKSNGSSLTCVTVATVDWSSPGPQVINNTRINLTGMNRVVVTNGSGVPTTSIVTNTELLYLSGVSSNIQTQLNAKISTETDPSVMGFAKTSLPTCGNGEVLKSNGTSFSCVTDATGSGGSAFTGTPHRIVTTDASGNLDVTAISDTVLGYLSGVTSSVQTQLNAKQGAVSKTSDIELRTVKIFGGNTTNYVELTAPTLSSNVVLTLPATDGTANQILATDGNGVLSWVNDNSGAGAFSGAANSVVVTNSGGTLGVSSVTTTELGRLAGVTGDVQTQINSKQATLTSTSDLLGDQVRIYNGANYVELLSPTLAGNVTFTLPGALGSDHQILKTNATGVLSWGNPGDMTVDWSSTGAEILHPSRLNFGLGNASKVLTTNGISDVVTSSVTSTELGYLAGAASNIQDQLDSLTASPWQVLAGNTFYNAGKVGIGVSAPDTILHIHNPVMSVGSTPLLKLSGVTEDAGGSTGDVSFTVGTGEGADSSWSLVNGSAIEFDIDFGGTPYPKIYRFKGASTAQDVDITDGRMGISTYPGPHMSLLDLGRIGNGGSLSFFGNTSGYTTIKPSAAAGAWTLTLPPSQGTTGQVLVTNGSGVTSWQTVAASGSSFTDGDIPQAKVNGLVTALSGKEPTITAGSITQYLRGDKSLSTFATDAINSALTGFGTGSNTGITASDTVISAFEKTQAQLDAKVNSSSMIDWTQAGVPTIHPSRVNLTNANVVVVTNSGGTLTTVPSVTTTILGYLSTISSNVQTQIDNLVTSVNTLSSQTPSAWSARTASFTAVANGRYLINTTSGGITLTLPAAAALGDTVTIVDGAGTFDTNNLTVGRNGLRIMGLTEDMTVSNKNISLELVYYDSANGWRVK